jgi:hypothetical protein
MAKKGKDTLNKLSEFLKDQGTEPTKKESSPKKKEEFLAEPPLQLVEIEKIEQELKRINKLPIGQLKEQEIADFVRLVALENGTSIRQVLYRVVQEVLTKIKDKDSTDLMMLNTCLYLEYHDALNARLKS